MVVWKSKMPVIMTASWREVLIPTQPVSNATWERKKKPTTNNKKKHPTNPKEKLKLRSCQKVWTSPFTGNCESRQKTKRFHLYLANTISPSTSLLLSGQTFTHAYVPTSLPMSAQPWECSLPVDWYCCRAGRESAQTGSGSKNYPAALKSLSRGHFSARQWLTKGVLWQSGTQRCKKKEIKVCTYLHSF